MGTSFCIPTSYICSSISFRSISYHSSYIEGCEIEVADLGCQTTLLVAQGMKLKVLTDELLKSKELLDVLTLVSGPIRSKSYLESNFQLVVDKGDWVIFDRRLNIIIKDALHKLCKDVPRVEKEELPQSLKVLNQSQLPEYHVKDALVNQLILLLHNVRHALTEG